MVASIDAETITLVNPKFPHTSVKVLKYGATVISWNVNGSEKLFLSDSAHLSESTPISKSEPVRGGIPLVFPRFGPAGNHGPTDSLPHHGFACRSTWEYSGEADEKSVKFTLKPQNSRLNTNWDYNFELIYTVSIVSENELELTMDVLGDSTQAFDFNVLIHTHFKVPDLNQTQITGLQDVDYFDKCTKTDEKGETKPVTISDEIDRVYRGTSKVISINYDEKPLFTIKPSPSFSDTVVWTPWLNGAKELDDFSPKSAYKEVVCVESGKVARFAKVEPKRTWQGSVTYKAY